MKFTANNLNVKKLMNGNTELTIELDDRQNKLINQIASQKELFANKLEISMEKFRQKRSMNHNRLFWDMCNYLAEHINDPFITSQSIYADLIKHYGVSTIYPVQDDMLDYIVQDWQGRGQGWLTERLRKSTLEGNYTNVQFWFGSSVYNSKQFWRIVEGLKAMCSEYDLDISYYDQSMRAALERLEEKEKSNVKEQTQQSV